MSIVISRRYKKESHRDLYSESPQTTRPTSSPPSSPPPFITLPSDPESDHKLLEPSPTHTGISSPFDDPTTTLGNALSGAGSAEPPEYAPPQDPQPSKAEIEPTPGQEQLPPMQPPSTTTAGTPQAGWVSPFSSSPQMPSAPLPPSTTPAAPEKPPRTLVLCFDGTGDSFDKDVRSLLGF